MICLFSYCQGQELWTWNFWIIFFTPSDKVFSLWCFLKSNEGRDIIITSIWYLLLNHWTESYQICWVCPRAPIYCIFDNAPRGLGRGSKAMKMRGSGICVQSYHLMGRPTFDLILHVPVNSFSVMSGWIFLRAAYSVSLKDTTQSDGVEIQWATLRSPVPVCMGY